MIVLIQMNYIMTEKPYHLNTLSLAVILVGNLFGWRKKDTSDEQNICPYCNTPNPIGAKECKLCYYNLDRSARDQPMATPSATESDIMTTLLNQETDDEEGDDFAVEAVLSLEDVTVEVDQFEVEDGGQDAGFDFISSSGPTLSEVQNYETPREVELSKDDAPSKQIDFVVPVGNPLDEVAEPVHTGQGSLFTVDIDSNTDLSGSVGPSSENMQPQIIEEEIATPDLPFSDAVSTETLNTPEVPEIPDVEQLEQTAAITPEVPEIPESVDNTPEVPDIPQGDSTIESLIVTPEVPEIPQGDSITENPIVTPEVPDIPDVNDTVNQKTVASNNVPEPQHNGRIWPWPAKDAWDERQVYREVVTMLELIKTGKLTQAAQQLDNLGPHLDGNLDMLAHIGTIMRYLGREEHLQWMLQMAQITYPNDSNVAKAMTHLS